MADRAVVNQQMIGRHSTPPIERFFNFTKSRQFTVFLLFFPLLWLLFPALMYASILPYLVFVYINITAPFTLPVHLPITARKYYPIDKNNLKAGRDKRTGNSIRKPIEPVGQVYIGNLQYTNEQVWFDKPLTCTHLIFFATTGGGKTFSFTGLLANFIICSGFCYTDAKADLGLVENFARMIFRQGRINDLFILSFQQGNRSPWMIAKSEKISHSMNPCASASAPLIAEVFKSLLDGEGDIWAKRADNLSSVLIRPITYMRDKFHWPMGFGVIASYFTLERLGYLCQIGSNNNPDYPIPEEDMRYFAPLIDFISTLPGMTDAMYAALVQQNKQAMGKITGTVRDQLGFVTMQLVNVTNDLVGDYSHIFETAYGQLDLEDAMVNRRFVLALLPAMERSDSSMANLGKIVLALQKAIVANAMSFRISGNLSEHNSSRPTNADYPFVSVNDEAGSFLTQGVSTTTAQSRSSNVAFWFGGQDMQAMKKRGGVIEKEVDTIIGTTVNKLAGSLLDTNTVDMFIKYAHKELRLEATEQSRENKGFIEQREENRLTVQERDRLTPQMLQEQAEGQAYLITKSKINKITLPNYTTKDLGKKLSNFVMFESIPVKPMPKASLTVLTELEDAYMTAYETRNDIFANVSVQNKTYISDLSKRLLSVIDASVAHQHTINEKLLLALHALLATTIYTRELHLRTVDAISESFDMVTESDCQLINAYWPTDFAKEQAFFIAQNDSDADSGYQVDGQSLSSKIESLDDDEQQPEEVDDNHSDVDEITLDEMRNSVNALMQDTTDAITSQNAVIGSEDAVQANTEIAKGSSEQLKEWSEGDLFNQFLGEDAEEGDGQSTTDEEEGSSGASIPSIALDASEVEVDDALPLSLPTNDLATLNERLYAHGIDRIELPDALSGFLEEEQEEAAPTSESERQQSVREELEALNALEAYRPDHSVKKAVAIDVLQRLTDSVNLK